jgi:glycine/serine hydroxymethyltransferase
MKTIARLISDILKHPQDETRLLAIREEVKTLCHRFPLYYERRNNFTGKRG